VRLPAWPLINVTTSLIVDAYNIDDIERVRVNGTVVGGFNYSQTGLLDVTNWLTPGLNVVEIELENLQGGWTYGFRLWADGVLSAGESCGTAGVRAAITTTTRRASSIGARSWS